MGINSQIYSNSGGYMGMSFAVPIDVAHGSRRSTQDRRAGSPGGWLGVEIQKVSRELAESFGLEQPRGALITQVFPNSPGEAGGLLAGDIITEFNGHTIDLWSGVAPLRGPRRAAAAKLSWAWFAMATK